jgi:hypothetical protein
MDQKAIGWECVGWIHLVQDRDQCVDCNVLQTKVEANILRHERYLQATCRLRENDRRALKSIHEALTCDTLRYFKFVFYLDIEVVSPKFYTFLLILPSELHV